MSSAEEVAAVVAVVAVVVVVVVSDIMTEMYQTGELQQVLSSGH